MNRLSDIDIRVLHEALDDEYRSWATYDQVITDSGEVRPFISIRDAESRHIEALSGLFARFGVPLPANPWVGKVERYASLQAACEAGVAGETGNGEMCERLVSQTRRADILTVLRNLQQASQPRHLAAFQRCAQRGAGGGAGRGARHRRQGV